MRKTKFNLSMLAMCLAASLTLTACGGGDDDGGGKTPDNPSNPETPVDPVTPDKEKAMTPTEQKEYMETVANQFMQLVPAADFKQLVDLGYELDDLYADYDFDDIGSWAENILEATRQSLGTTVGKPNSWNVVEVLDNYKQLIMASNFHAHFTAANGGWKQSKADDLQFIFNDKSGKQCVLKLVTSGKVKKVHMFNLDDWTDWQSKYETGDYYYYDYYDRTQYTVGVPEKIEVSLTRGGSDVVKTTLNITLSDIANEEFDLSKDNLSLTLSTELNNGYKLNVTQCAYQANKKVSVAATLQKGSTTLVAMGVASDVSGLPSCNVSAFTPDFDGDAYNFDDANGKNAVVRLDVLGKMQLQGTLTDVRKYADYLDKADDNDDRESTFKSYLNQANQLADINLFYEGKKEKQASVRWEPFADESWGHTSWDAEPVIVFYDGTSYSTFEAFFNDADFKSTINTFKALADKYADLFDERIDW